MIRLRTVWLSAASYTLGLLFWFWLLGVGSVGEWVGHTMHIAFFCAVLFAWRDAP